jgi:uncharacterized membrane protein
MMPLPARLVAALYMLFAILALFLLAPAMPPFQNADEAAHAFRADQISHGRMLAEKLPGGTSGGSIDSGLRDVAQRFSTIPFFQDRKVTRAMYAPLDWGIRTLTGFPNTAIYPPVFYLPAAVSLFAARTGHVSVLRGLELARLATGAVTIAIGATAIALAEEAATWLFAILLLPMSLCLAAAVSQDGPLLASTALAVVLCRRVAVAEASPRLLAVLSLLLALVALARPPYAAFALLVLGAQAPLRARILATFFVPAATLAWGMLNARLVQLPSVSGGVVDPAAQLWHLFSAPWHIPALLANTWRFDHIAIFMGFIGSPGWQDVALPGCYYRATCLMVALTFVLFLIATRPRGRTSLLVAAAILTASCGIALLQYLTWTKVGATHIDGLQGRYFLAPALLIAALPAGTRQYEKWAAPIQAAVLAFPFISIPVLMTAIRFRYYS